MFKLFAVDQNFEKTINEFCKNHKTIIKWELLNNKNVLAQQILLVEYRG